VGGLTRKTLLAAMRVRSMVFRREICLSVAFSGRMPFRCTALAVLVCGVPDLARHIGGCVAVAAR